MSRYQQFCGVARGLDIIGDRWTLLIVRELLLGPRRYTDLRDGLPSIASNLLSRRLDELQQSGVIERRLAGRGVRYALTPWGEQLRGVVHEVVRWSVPVMTSGPHEGDAFRPQWLAIALEAFLAGVQVDEPIRIALETAAGDRVIVRAGPFGADVTLNTADAGTDVTAEAGGSVQPGGDVAATLTARGPLLLALASGVLTVDDLMTRGARVTGDITRIITVFDRAGTTATPRSASASPA